MTLIQRFMRLFYRLLYRPFAFAYDLVAWAVSFGRWNDWVFRVVPFLEGTRVLELGYGPGHLQRLLRTRGWRAFGIDESPQMGKLAKRRLGHSFNLARGLAQSLPYAHESFDCAVSTFPSEYIFDPQTLFEAKRILRNGGRLVVLPAAFPSSGLLKWLYQVTGESPAALDESIKEKFAAPFIQAGFDTKTEIVEVQSATLFFIVAVKK